MVLEGGGGGVRCLHGTARKLRRQGGEQRGGERRANERGGERRIDERGGMHERRRNTRGLISATGTVKRRTEEEEKGMR